MFQFDGSTAAAVAEAERGIVELDGRVVALVDTEALSRLLLCAEAVASSRIEGLEIGPRRLLEADALRAAGGTANDVTAAEVLANIDAMAYATQAIDAGDEIHVDHLLELHRRLLGETRLSEHAGRIRTAQNWIGGSAYNPCRAAFVPPPADEVPSLLADLCTFCNDDALPASAQAAIAHAQFETIHPFVDGNGRVGRALIHLVLRRRGLERCVVPPISLELATRADAYIDAVAATRYDGAPGSPEARAGASRWLALFATACVRAVKDSQSFEDRVAQVQHGWREQLGATRSHAAALAVTAVLSGTPILTVKTAATLTGRSKAAVNAAMTRLLEVGIVRQTRAQARNRVFEAREIIDAFAVLERGLASLTADTSSASPPRPSLTVRQRRLASSHR